MLLLLDSRTTVCLKKKLRMLKNWNLLTSILLWLHSKSTKYRKDMPKKEKDVFFFFLIREIEWSQEIQGNKGYCRQKVSSWIWSGWNRKANLFNANSGENNIQFINLLFKLFSGNLRKHMPLLLSAWMICLNTMTGKAV